MKGYAVAPGTHPQLDARCRSPARPPIRPSTTWNQLRSCTELDPAADMNEPTPDAITDEAAMRLALEEAAAALAHDDVPIGAVVLVGGEVVARRHNERERLGDPTAHAEVLALRDAARRPRHRAGCSDATLVVTVEPCPLCAGAVWAAQVGRVVFGAADLKAGAMGSLYNFAVDQRLNHETEVVAGVLAEECGALLTGVLRRADADRAKAGRAAAVASPPEGCRSGRTGRSRKPLWLQDHRGFKSHTLRHRSLVSDVNRTPSAGCRREPPLRNSVAGELCVGPPGITGELRSEPGWRVERLCLLYVGELDLDRRQAAERTFVAVDLGDQSAVQIDAVASLLDPPSGGVHPERLGIGRVELQLDLRPGEAGAGFDGEPVSVRHAAHPHLDGAVDRQVSLAELHPRLEYRSVRHRRRSGTFARSRLPYAHHAPTRRLRAERSTCACQKTVVQSFLMLTTSSIASSPVRVAAASNRRRSVRHPRPLRAGRTGSRR